ncbi:AraC family transcriptional regulator [Hoylesella timonensis]|uniref:AraC family transcriptional regulator n=1 Tax=Hoylesella timonensis TaxID=386414 RepID=A0A2K0XE88_9BACT|nr:AraC family transcriptional regulator [Hoylesella timonensis]PNP92850.1 AraC family transcriptional regulator [Hoylesella timonensis]
MKNQQKSLNSDRKLTSVGGSVLYIKNMVCDRCIMAVRLLLQRMGIAPQSVELGVVRLAEELSKEQLEMLQKDLLQLGFELLDDKRQQTIDRIKTLIVDLVHYHDNRSELNLSDYLAQQLHSEYSSLSKLFSEFTGITIERYFILQRIERVKELIFYDQLSLTEIAYKLNYSSVAYLSSQFKQITGMTPSQFKALKKNIRRGLDTI